MFAPVTTARYTIINSLNGIEEPLVYTLIAFTAAGHQWSQIQPASTTEILARINRSLAFWTHILTPFLLSFLCKQESRNHAALEYRGGTTSQILIGSPVASQIAFLYFSALMIPFIVKYMVTLETPHLRAISAPLTFFIIIAIFIFCSKFINMDRNITKTANLVKEKMRIWQI